MKAAFIVLIVLCGAGCATTNFGPPFDASVHGIAEPGMSKVIVYRSNDGLFNRIHVVNIASVRTARLVRGGFIEQALPAGQHSVTAGSASADVALRPGEIVFLQIGEETTSAYFECGIENETARLCLRTVVDPTLEVVAAATALPRLASMKEICNDC